MKALDDAALWALVVGSFIAIFGVAGAIFNLLECGQIGVVPSWMIVGGLVAFYVPFIYLWYRDRRTQSLAL